MLVASSVRVRKELRPFALKVALPNNTALFTRSRHRDHQFAVLLGDEVFGAAG
jgi:hypothetical protein